MIPSNEVICMEHITTETPLWNAVVVALFYQWAEDSYHKCVVYTGKKKTHHVVLHSLSYNKDLHWKLWFIFSSQRLIGINLLLYFHGSLITGSLGIIMCQHFLSICHMPGTVLIILFIISSSLQPHEMLLLFSSTWDVWGLERLSYPRSFIQWDTQLPRGWNQTWTRCFWIQCPCSCFSLDCNY